MATARQRLLAYFAKTRTASTREISRALKMSAATVRHHLRVLAADGRLEMTAVRGRDSRGRPEKIYSLPRSTLGDNLPVLSDALLTESGSRVSVEALAERLAGGSSSVNQPLAKRLNLTVEKLNQMNYHARWEAGPDGPRILFAHCPYASILEKHPVLCRMDEAMLQKLTGQPARQIFRTGKDGSTVCVFVMESR
ncbi:MAG TPA: winged helix-turn-helix transcriptional regulator [Anaerolineales bacterium]|jgi:predicted ArsR family transcriptional regulator|nr:winged helix-turn-helix transcriptional regulator [Anaerolineales bacterium]